MRTRAALVVILALTALVYWPGLGGPFVFDDTNNLAPIQEWLRGDRPWTWVVFGNASGLFGRPLSMASFVANVALLGPSAWDLKLGNLLLHLLNGALVYALFRAFARRNGTIEATPAIRWLPLVAAAVWLLHPLLVSTVLYVVQRMAMLSACFTLLTLLAYLHGRTALELGRKRQGMTLLLLAVPALTALAALSKENGILAPSLCALAEWFAFAPPQGKRRSTYSSAFIFAALAMPAIAAVLLTALQVPAIVGDYQTRTFTLSERLLTQPRVLWDYVSSLVVPYGPSLGVYHDDYIVSTGLLNPPQTLLAILGWAAVVAAAWVLRRRIPGFALGSGIFLVGHALESSVFPLLMYFEHRNYLPAVGAIWALASLIAHASARLDRHMHHARAIRTASTIAILCVLALATAARAGIWGNRDAILEQALRYHPTSKGLRTDLAQRALEGPQPDYATARSQFDHLARSGDAATRRLAFTWQVLIDCASDTGAKPAVLAGAFDGPVIAIEADQLLAYEALANGVVSKGCPGLSTESLADSLVRVVENARIGDGHYHVRRMRFKAAQVYLAADDIPAAEEQARLADSGEAVDAPMAALLAELEIRTGDLRAADALIARLEQQIPRNDKVGRKVLSALRDARGRAAGPAPR